jgi:septal ring factor EnvC (AmiA/AmiB activator)
MARPANLASFSIAQLEKYIASQRSKLSQLRRERAQLQNRLDDLDRKIASMNGAGGAAAARGGRARNAQSLVATLETVLADGKPMGVGDILDGVKKRGYRSGSANFRAIVNQTLIKERKRFANAGRGLYQLKK